MAKRLPSHLKGPFVCSSYDINNATLYLKQPDGQYVSTITYPAFFIKTKEKSRFPFDEFGKYVLEQYNEGEFTRFTYDPTLRYEDRRVMVEICESEHVELYEADASATRRFFSDTGALVAQKFRSLMFDLETDPLIVGFSDEAIKTHRIISFAAYDCDDPSKSWYYAVQESTNEEEAKLLHYFQQIIKPYDTLLAWNGDGYDFVVLKERAKRAKIRINWRDWNLLDYMRVVKKLLMSVTDTTMKRSFALDAIGENVLGIRKIQLKVKYKHIATLLQGEENRRHLEEYNRHDVVIMTTLDQKREFLSLHYALCSFCRTFPGHPSIFPNELADGILLRLAVQEGKHFPTRKGWDVDDHKKKYEGAYVSDPVEGFHLDVQVPDFASLYPSIIISWNMSNETMIQENQPYPFGIESYLATATATGVKFRTDIEGIIPKALKQLIIKRKEYKVRADASPVGSEEWKSMNNLSTAVKVVTNSFYGLLGNDGSRYYARDIARSVTLTAQLLIREMIRYFGNKGYKTLYTDTDSVFVQCTIDQIKNELEYINKTYLPNLLNGFGCNICAAKLEFDKSFATLLLVTKKRYVGRLALSKGRPAPPDMEPEIKGIEVQRSDETRYGQRLLKEFIMMLIEKDCDPIQVERKLRIEGEKFYATTLTREELEITKSVSRKPEDYPSKPTAVKVAEQLIAEGEEFFIGMKIPYIVIEHDPYVKGIHADKYEGKYDKVYYWEHKILPPIQRLLDARFPKYPFKSFKNPNQMALDFFAEPEPCLTVRQPKVRIPKIMAQTIKLPEEKKIRMPVAKITVEGTNPDVIKGIARVAKVYPGKFKLKLDLKLGSGVTTIDTNDTISTEGLKEIEKLFPAVQIVPKPI